MHIRRTSPVSARLGGVAAVLLACSAGAVASTFELRQPLQGVVAAPAVPPIAAAPVPLASVSPNAFEFQSTSVGSAAVPVAVSLVNEGAVAVDIAGAEIAPPFAIASQSCASSLAVGESCTYSVAFSPLAAVGYSEQLLVSTSAGVLTILFSGVGAEPPPEGSVAFTVPGTYAWIAPAGVTSVSAVAVGGGGLGGGGLGWKNNIAVVPGASYSVVVGAGSLRTNVAAGTSYFGDAALVAGRGAGHGGVNTSAPGGSFVGDGGGNGGKGEKGGGGAGGYTGNGGNGVGSGYGLPGSSGTGGAGGGGGSNPNGYPGGGGGVGLYGQGPSGAGGQGIVGNTGGKGGSDGEAGTSEAYNRGLGGLYGGGGGGGYDTSTRGRGGAVRIIWGAGRSFPYNAN